MSPSIKIPNKGWWKGFFKIPSLLFHGLNSGVSHFFPNGKFLTLTKRGLTSSKLGEIKIFWGGGGDCGKKGGGFLELQNFGGRIPPFKFFFKNPPLILFFLPLYTSPPGGLGGENPNIFFSPKEKNMGGGDKRLCRKSPHTLFF